ncbi:MAG: NADH-quinone oxidoreductase subunit C, partial [Terriglobales bacterium]
MDQRTLEIRSALDGGARLGLITSLDGAQLITLLLLPNSGAARCLVTEVQAGAYRSVTPTVPQAHWFERTTWDMFGLYPEGHLRPKRTHLHEPYGQSETPLSSTPSCALDRHQYQFMSVDGEGVYEIPVGPI